MLEAEVDGIFMLKKGIVAELGGVISRGISPKEALEL